MSEKDLQRILKLLKKISAASATNFPEPEDFIRLMQQDKKVHAGKLNLILLKKIGEAVKTSAVTVAEIQKMLKRFFSALDYFEK
jgi:3-dehydroquinate synthetase